MIVLWLLGAHMVGDFVLQSRVHALLKLQDPAQRTAHVMWYVLAFVPVVLVADWGTWPNMAGFLGGLYILHWLTDSRRFHSNVGDLIAWRLSLWHDPVGAKKVWLEYVTERAESGTLRAIDVDDAMVRWPPPNPWAPLPLMIDQTLHVLQLALLGSLFLV